MNREATTRLTEEIKIRFRCALEQVIDKISEMIEDKREENEQDDIGNQKATMTVQPKIRIDYSAPSEFAVKVTVPAKRTEIITGESEGSFNLNQPDLPKVPTDKNVTDIQKKFYHAVRENSNVSEGELDEYFAANDDWNDFEGWLNDGNAERAELIISSEEERERFVTDVEALL